MEKITKKELIDSLDFTGNHGQSITVGQELFDSHLESWLSNEVQEEWLGDIVIMSPAFSDSFAMSRTEFEKL